MASGSNAFRTFRKTIKEIKRRASSVAPEKEGAPVSPAPLPESFPHANKGTGELVRSFLRGGGLLVPMAQILGDQACVLADRGLDFLGNVLVVCEELARGLAALADSLAAEGEPRSRLLDHIGLHAEVEQLAGLGNAVAVHDVEFDLLERRGDLVLDHLHARLVADHLVAVLDRADTTDVEADRGIEFERIAARRRLRVAEHDADLHPDLVDEDDKAVRARDRARKLAQGLAHQTRLQAWKLVAHLAFELGLRRQSGNRVDHHHIDAPGAYERVGDLERLLARVGLRDQKLIDIDAEFARIDRIERMLRIDIGDDSALLLRFGHRMESERGLAGRLRSVDFDDAPAREAADAERDIEPEGA